LANQARPKAIAFHRYMPGVGAAAGRSDALSENSSRVPLQHATKTRAFKTLHFANLISLLTWIDRTLWRGCALPVAPSSWSQVFVSAECG